jgi:hypothetical protein
MSDNKYNGWTNYETWVCKLWMDNDEGSQEHWREQAQWAYENPVKNQYMELERRRVARLVDCLKIYHDEQAEQFMSNQSSVFADLLNASLGSVNWYEIAESLLEEIEEVEA